MTPQDMHDEPADGGLFAPDLHDRHHLWLKAILLAAWVVFSFGACYFARDLQAWTDGWPLGYWMAAQGAVLMFIALTLVYCVAMDQFEQQDSSHGPAKPGTSEAAAPASHGRAGR